MPKEHHTDGTRRHEMLQQASRTIHLTYILHTTNPVIIQQSIVASDNTSVGKRISIKLELRRLQNAQHAKQSSPTKHASHAQKARHAEHTEQVQHAQHAYKVLQAHQHRHNGWRATQQEQHDALALTIICTLGKTIICTINCIRKQCRDD